MEGARVGAIKGNDLPGGANQPVGKYQAEFTPGIKISGLSKFIRGMGQIGTIVGGIMSGFEYWDAVTKNGYTGGDAFARTLLYTAASTVGSLAGSIFGASLGSSVGAAGGPPGALAGGIVGSIGGAYLGGAIADLFIDHWARTGW
jgi:hypothetical protein